MQWKCQLMSNKLLEVWQWLLTCVGSNVVPSKSDYVWNLAWELSVKEGAIHTFKSSPLCWSLSIRANLPLLATYLLLLLLVPLAPPQNPFTASWRTALIRMIVTTKTKALGYFILLYFLTEEGVWMRDALDFEAILKRCYFQLTDKS